MNLRPLQVAHFKPWGFQRFLSCVRGAGCVTVGLGTDLLNNRKFMNQDLLPYIDSLLTMRWKLVVVLFLAGLCLRAPIFVAPHTEGDELIYMTLVEQLESGNGYTLQGSPILEQGVIDREQYDHPLFFHPPGGIALFRLFVRPFGAWGYPLVQLFSYALFFWSMMFLARSLKVTASDLGLALVAALSAFNPIMTHVTLKFWLDGPLLAFATLAFALFVRAVERQSSRLALVAGLVLGYASLIKVTAFLVVPGALLLAWPLLNPAGMRNAVRFALLLILPAIVVQLPWELWQWQAVGSPFPGWAGKPSAGLIARNDYIHYLTVIRSPWVYLTLTPMIVWTLVPGILMLPLVRDDREVRRFGFACLVWIVTVIGFHVAVGFLGYSRVLRYIILITPATVLLFARLLPEVVQKVKGADGSPRFRGMAGVAIAVALVAFVLEIAAGVQAAANYQLALILPLFGQI
jgi:4-amino-4-deoxy-L-arabinose transferase-like glycosyltransferase